MTLPLALMTLILNAGTVEPPVITEAALMQSLRSLPTKRAPFGSAEHVAGLVKTEELIIDRLKAMGYQPQVQEIRWSLPKRDQAGDGKDPGDAGEDAGAPPDEEPVEPRVWHNIFVDLPGIEHPGEVLIVGAHFDSVRQGPGADDNGTGTAALLELAGVLHGREMKRSVRIIFFNLEEVGLIGSQAYVNDWANKYREPRDGDAADPVKPERIIGMISLEMLGYFTDEPGSQRSPIKAIPGVFEPSTTGDFIAMVGLQSHQTFSRRLAREMQAAEPTLKITLVDFLPIPVPDMARSDHAPFWLAGQPAVMLTDTANFRNPHYHKASDTIETIDAARFTLVASAVAQATVAIADGPPLIKIEDKRLEKAAEQLEKSGDGAR